MSSAHPAARALEPARARILPARPPVLVDALDQRLLVAIQDGLPLVSRPYLAIAGHLGLTEDEVLRRLQRLIDCGVIKRFGVVVRHHELGFRANAMVVWDVPDEDVDAVGRRLASCEAVRLCYRRPRCPPHWPYNLFCMIHGRDRVAVRRCVDDLVERFRLQEIRHDVLFSGRRFKQRGARYAATGSSR